MALRSACVALAFLVAAQACLLPPHGCFKAACDNYGDMKIPHNSGNWALTSSWSSPYSKLAFVRSSFNKNLGNIGPSAFTAATWFDLLKGYGNNVKSGPPALPSVNYEFYNFGGGSKYTAAPKTVTYGGVTYNSSASLAACCHACRVTEGCPLYAFLPAGAASTLTSVKGGTCYFFTTGDDTRDGPFDFTDGTNQYSLRTKNLKAPAALNQSATSAKLSNNNLYPTYYQVFLGGYCNPWKFKNGTATDDPHFVGAHGTRFDFNGELNKAFCLMTDKRLAVNALLKGYTSDNVFGATVDKEGKGIRSWIKELGIVWTDGKNVQHKFHLVARTGKAMARGDGFLAFASFDGVPVDVPKEDGSSFKAADLTFTFLGSTRKGWYDLDKYQVTLGQKLDLLFNMRVAHPKLQTPTDAEAHFNLVINDVRVSPSVHGVLGQTYRNSPQQIQKAIKYTELNRLLGAPVKADGESGAGFLEGSVQDYEASHILGTDCKVSTYDV